MGRSVSTRRLFLRCDKGVFKGTDTGLKGRATQKVYPKGASRRVCYMNEENDEQEGAHYMYTAQTTLLLPVCLSSRP
jgi:hypothetical protein